MPDEDVLDFFAVVKKYYGHKLRALQARESTAREHARTTVAGAQHAVSQALDRLADGADAAAGDGQQALTRAV
eukprot:176348-Chlamydomonas_euryale.AAC.1